MITEILIFAACFLLFCIVVRTILERPVLWLEKIGGGGGVIKGYFKCSRSSDFQ